MANENDVVRLKHLQPLVSGVANDFSIQNGDNAVRLKHLVSLASALNNDKQTPVLSLGSWSAVDTVYSAPITYTGDGTLATDIGTIANDILTVADEDGNFNGVISASAGDDFDDSSLAFNFTTDTITIQGGEDRLSKILNGSPDYELAGVSSISLQYGEITGSLETSSAGVTRIGLSDGEFISYGQSVSSAKLFKTSETSAACFVSTTVQNGSYYYDGPKTLYYNYKQYETGSSEGNTPYTGGSVSICAAVSSVAASMESSEMHCYRSILDKNDFLVLVTTYKPKRTDSYTVNPTAYHFACCGIKKVAYRLIFGNNSGNYVTSRSFAPYPTEIKKAWSAECTFSGNQVSVQKGSNPKSLPVIYQNASGTRNVYINFGGSGNSTLTSNDSSGVTPFNLGTSGTWIEDDDNIILGFWFNKEKNTCYGITFKEGTYDRNTWLEDCFTVWGFYYFSYTKGKIIKTNLKITDIIDDLLL